MISQTTSEPTPLFKTPANMPAIVKRLRVALLFAFLGPAIGAGCVTAFMLVASLLDGGASLAYLPFVFLFGYLIGLAPAVLTGALYAQVLPIELSIVVSAAIGGAISALLSAIVFHGFPMAVVLSLVAGAASAIVCAMIARRRRWDGCV